MLQAADALLVNQRAAVGEMSLPSKFDLIFRVGSPRSGGRRTTERDWRGDPSGGSWTGRPARRSARTPRRAQAARSRTRKQPRGMAQVLAGTPRRASLRNRILADYEAFAFSIAGSGRPGSSADGQGDRPPTATRRREGEQQQ